MSHLTQTWEFSRDDGGSEVVRRVSDCYAVTSYAPRWSRGEMARTLRSAMFAMRERTPRSGFGFALTMLVFVAATVLMLSIIMEKFPRP